LGKEGIVSYKGDDGAQYLRASTAGTAEINGLSSLVNNGRSLYEVQTLLGHSTSTMTQRYAHLSNESLMSAASCASSLI
jgi:integrase